MFYSIFFKASLGSCFNIESEYWKISCGENVGVNSLLVPCFVKLISFIKCAKKMLTVIRSLSISTALFVDYFIFIGKQIWIPLGLT